MRLRRILLLLLALGAAVSSAQAVRSWLEGRDRARAATPAPVRESPSMAVLVAAERIPAGSFVSQRSLAWQVWPDVDVPESFVLRGEARIEDFRGAVARRDLFPGEPVAEGVLVRPGERGFLAAVLEPGMRAVSVPIDEATGNAGLVFPGDRVDLVLTQRLKRRGGGGGSASETVVRDVRVLAVGRRLSGAGTEPELTPAKVRTVTLEVTPEGAKRVALAQQLGRLVLSLRSLARGPAAEQASAAAGADEDPLWDRELSRAVGARRGVLVLRGSESEKLDVAVASNDAETAPEAEDEP